MVDTLARSLLQGLLGAQWSGAGVHFEGLTCRSIGGSLLEVGAGKLDAKSLRLASGPVAVDIGAISAQHIVVQVDLDAGTPRLRSLDAAVANVAGLRVHGPLLLSSETAGPQPASSGDWSLGPLAGAEGELRAEIVDAHLVFDADVTIPIRQGRVDFSEATVQHVGPDSRMGVSRMGVYVDAPNGRSYLYQFAAPTIAGIEFEHRGALLAPWMVTQRGRLHLQPFVEALLRQGPVQAGLGVSAQTRMLLERTAASGAVRLGDGRFVAPAMQAELTGRNEGHNTIQFQSEAVGRGLSAEITSLAVRDVTLQLGAQPLACDTVTGAAALRVFSEGGQWRFAFEIPRLAISKITLGNRTVGHGGSAEPARGSSWDAPRT